MKNSKKFLATLALGMFIFATVGPVLTADNAEQETNVRRMYLTKRI